MDWLPYGTLRRALLMLTLCVAHGAAKADTLQGQVTTLSIPNARGLAVLDFQRYDTGYPIAFYRVTSLDGKPASAGLLVISGTEPGLGHGSTGILEDLAAAHGVPFDNFQQSVRQAVAELEASGDFPIGMPVIIVAHSLGAMEAQILEADGNFASNHKLIKAVYFGSPQVTRQDHPDLIEWYATRDDPVPYSTLPLAMFPPGLDRLIQGQMGVPPNMHVVDYDKPPWYNPSSWPGIRHLWAHLVYPFDHELDAFAENIEVDAGSMRAFSAPSFFLHTEEQPPTDEEWPVLGFGLQHPQAVH